MVAAKDVVAHVAPPFLEYFADTREPSHPAGILRSTLAKAARLGRHLPRLRSWADVSSIEDEYLRRFGQPTPVEFPPPPLPGTELVVPITTSDALVAEGRTLHHCIGSFAARVTCGQVYVYQLLAPERATVAIVRRAERWELLEMRGDKNVIPAEPAQRAVQAWLEGAQGEEREADARG